jgi:hypothetical protein
MWVPTGDTPYPSLTDDAVGPLARVRIAADGGLTARPAEALRYDKAGLR